MRGGFILLLLLGAYQAALVLHSPDFPTPYMLAELNWGQKFPTSNISGVIVNPQVPEFIHGNILVADRLSIQFDWNIYYFQSQRPAALIMIAYDSIPGSDENLIDCWSCTADFQIPVFELSYLDAGVIFANVTGPIFATITPGDNINYWTYVKNQDGVVAATIIIAIMAVSAFGLALWKFISFVKSVGFQFSIAQVCLMAILLATLEYSLLYIGDPWHTRKRFPGLFFISFDAAPLPLIEVVILMVALYWHELLTMQKIRVSLFLGKLFIPFFIVSFATLALEYINALLRAFIGASPVALLIQVALTLAILITVSTIYFVVTIQLLTKLSKEKSMPKQKIRKQITLFALTASALLLRAVLSFAAVFFINIGPGAFIAIVLLNNFLQLWALITITLSFKPKNKAYKQKYQSMSTFSKSTSSKS